jgi:deoxyribonuclease-4
MLIGAHVSPSGGLYKAVERGEQIGARSIQIFNQSPRMWRPTAHTEDDFKRFRETMAASGVDAVVIHAVYLFNCASDDPEIAEKSRIGLTHALRVGDGIGAVGVVLHPGSAKKGPVAPAIERAGKIFEQALAETDTCALHLEDTAGAGGTLGRSFEELRDLVDASGGGERLGICLDSCHLFASGYDIRTEAGITSVLDDFDAIVGGERLHSLHVNDSQMGLGTNRDRHAGLGDGELGEDAIAAFLSEPRFDELPCILETPADGTKGFVPEDIAHATALRERGRRARGLA